MPEGGEGENDSIEIIEREVGEGTEEADEDVEVIKIDLGDMQVSIIF